MRLLQALICIALLQVTCSALADPQSQSYSSWKRVNNELQLRFTIASREVTRLLPTGNEAGLQAALISHLAENIAVFDQQEICKPLGLPINRTAKRGYLIAQMRFECQPLTQDHLSLKIKIDAFFNVAQSHVHFAKFDFGERSRFEQLYTHRQRVHTIDKVAAVFDNKSQAANDQASDSKLATTSAYAVLGFQHILEGLDHIAFLLALMLLVKRFKDVAWIVTGFTVGHSITLSLAVLNVVQANMALVEAVIGLTIALVAIENVGVRSAYKRTIPALVGAALLVMSLVSLINGTAHPSALSLLGLAMFSYCYLTISNEPARALRIRPGITLMFGMVHGFGFANVLQEVGIPDDRALFALFGFNLGVEVGQLLIVLLMSLLLILFLAVFKNWNKLLAADLLSTLLCGLGTFWFVQRAYM
ncbi:MAG: HupE/UreJ family protein [Pseudomonadales bacterium]